MNSLNELDFEQAKDIKALTDDINRKRPEYNKLVNQILQMIYAAAKEGLYGTIVDNEQFPSESVRCSIIHYLQSCGYNVIISGMISGIVISWK